MHAQIVATTAQDIEIGDNLDCFLTLRLSSAEKCRKFWRDADPSDAAEKAVREKVLLLTRFTPVLEEISFITIYRCNVSIQPVNGGSFVVKARIALEAGTCKKRLSRHIKAMYFGDRSIILFASIDMS